MLVPVLSRRVTGGHGRVALCAGAGLLLLGGCALLQPPPKPPHPVAHAPPKPHPAPTAAPTGSAAAAGALHPQPSAPVSSGPTPTAAAAPPVHVVGWSQEAVRRLLGPPAELSAQGAGQTWRYRSPECQVDIAFYYDVTRGDFFALSQHPVEGGDAGACLARVQAAHGN